MKKKKVLITLFITSISIIALSNTFLGIFLGKPLIHVYNYESSDGSFTEIEVPEKGRDLKMVEALFEDYKKSSGKLDLILCRTFQVEVLHFYEWSNFLTHRRWDYPYKKSQRTDNKIN